MTDLDRIRARLEAIRGRVEGATEGPWEAWSKASESWYIEGPPDTSEPTGQFERVTDATFIAHARADVPWLVACLGVALVTLDEIAKGADGGELWEGSQDAAISALADIYDLSEGLVIAEADEAGRE